MLWQFFGGYLHQNWIDFHATPLKAAKAAIDESVVEVWQPVRRQLREILAEADDDKLRQSLDALGVDVYFKHAAEAREFAVTVDQMLLAAIEQHFQRHLNDRAFPSSSRDRVTSGSRN